MIAQWQMKEIYGGYDMSDFLKIGGKVGDNTAKGLSIDYSGNLILSPDRIPRIGSDYASNLVKKRKVIKSRYIESEVSIGGDYTKWATTSRGTISQDTENKEDGEYSIRYTANTTSEYYNPVYNFDVPVDMSDFDHIRFWMYTPDPSTITRIWIQFLTDDSNYYYINVLNGITYKFGKSELTYSKAVFQSVGTPNWASITKLRLQIKVSDVNTFINIQNIRLVKQKPKHGKLVIRIDDGLASVYDLAMPIMRKYGVVGTCYVLPEYSKSGQRSVAPSYSGTETMSLEELKYLASLGWSIASHSWMHNFFNADYNGKYYQAYNDLKATSNWLFDNGFEARCHVFGNHRRTKETMEACLDIFTVDNSCEGSYDTFDTLPWGGDSIIRCDGEEHTVEEIKAIIDTVAERKCLCTLFFHRFSENPEGTEFGTTALEEIIRYATHKDNIDLISMTDLLDGTPVALR